MSQLFIIWDNKTHSRDKHSSPQHAQAVIEALIEEGMGGGGKVFPVVAFFTADNIKFVAQDCLGTWWTFTEKPVLDAQGIICSLSGGGDVWHETRTGWWTDTLFNLEK